MRIARCPSDCSASVSGFPTPRSPRLRPPRETLLIWRRHERDQDSLGPVLLVCAVVLGFIWAATEWTAWQLAFQPQLGQPWFMLFGWPIYQPPAFFWWWFAYDAYAHDIFVTGGFIAGAGGVAAFVVAVAMSVWRAREVKRVTTYGSARWAEAREIRKAGLLHPDGVLLGRWRGAYLRHHGPEHVLCFAPTRSGKGVGLVVPTLLTWPGSAIVHDIKGENWGLTAGWRARFGRVLLFDPTNTQSTAYNPLLEVRRGEWEVRDVQNIADVLVDPEGALEKRNHWEKTSHSLLVGTILHVLYAEKDKTLAGVANFLSDPKRPIETTLRAMMTTPHLGKKGVHPVVASAARELLNKSENERSGVLVDRHVVPRALPRSGRRRRHGTLRLAHPRSRRGRASRDALPGRSSVGHQPDQASHPPDPQSDRPAPHRGAGLEAPPASAAAHAR